MISEGVGFRQFMDIALFSRDSNLNWDWIRTKLIQLNLWKFLKIVFAFIQRWFDTNAPIEVEKIDDDFFEIATQKIFTGGVFGHDDQLNKNTGITKQAINSGTSLRNARKKYLIQQLFPNYKTMCLLPYCSYINKSKLLLPIAWAHRIIYRGSNYKFRESFADRINLNSDLQKRLSLLKKWGL